jgi:hypothetical protein
MIIGQWPKGAPGNMLIFVQAVGFRYTVAYGVGKIDH